MEGEGGNNEFVLIEHAECLRRISEGLGDQIKELSTRVEKLEKGVINENLLIAFQSKLWEILKAFMILVFPMVLVFIIDHVFDNTHPYPAQESAQLFREFLIVMFMGLAIGYGTPAFAISLMELNMHLEDCEDKRKVRQDLQDLMEKLKGARGDATEDEEDEEATKGGNGDAQEGAEEDGSDGGEEDAESDTDLDSVDE